MRLVYFSHITTASMAAGTIVQEGSQWLENTVDPVGLTAYQLQHYLVRLSNAKADFTLNLKGQWTLNPRETTSWVVAILALADRVAALDTTARKRVWCERVRSGFPALTLLVLIGGWSHCIYMQLWRVVIWKGFEYKTDEVPECKVGWRKMQQIIHEKVGSILPGVAATQTAPVIVGGQHGNATPPQEIPLSLQRFLLHGSSPSNSANKTTTCHHRATRSTPGDLRHKTYPVPRQPRVIGRYLHNGLEETLHLSPPLSHRPCSSCQPKA